MGKAGRTGIRVAMAAVSACLVFCGAQPASAMTGAPITGSGSTSTENILDLWTADVAKYGIDANYIGYGTGLGDGAGHTIPGQNLGWTPSAIDLAPAQSVTLGPSIAPTAGGGLGLAQTLATGTGLGTAHLGAALDLDVPTTTLPGTYSATLTLTAI